jgi:hypothetical protein
MLAGTFTVADLDMFHGMALFREAVATGSLPHRDSFAYTPTVYPVVHHEWGTGALLYLITVAAGFGASGVMLLKYLLVASLLVVCAWCARLRGATIPIAGILAPPALYLAAVSFASIRAQLFSVVFLAVLLLLLESDRRGGRWWIAAWLPLYAVWVNLHGGFVVGAGALALYTWERMIRCLFDRHGVRHALVGSRHLIAVGAAMLPLTVVNPYGLTYVSYLWRAIRMPRPDITEWLPLWDSAHSRLLLAVFVISAAMAGYSVLARGLKYLPGLTLLAVTAWLAARHARHLSLYAVVWFCYVPAYLAETSLGRRADSLWRRFPLGITAAFLLLGGAALGHGVDLRFWELRVPNRDARTGLGFPVGVVDYLAAHEFEGNLMTPFNAGSYVSWKLYPSVKVSLDSRYEVAYPPGTLAESGRFYNAAEGWETILGKYPTDAVLVPREAPVAAALAAGGQWRRVYRDDEYALFVRPGLARTLPVLDASGREIRGAFP